MQPTNFNTLINWQQCSEEQQKALLSRPAINASERITAAVSDILDRVKAEGDSALRDFSQRFDHVQVADIRITASEIAAASARLSDDVKHAMAQAVRNIEIFHNAQKMPVVDVETQPGVRCQQITRPIASVGLYIPGGSAPLPSTVLMLGTPARIAGCQRVVYVLHRLLPMKFCMPLNCAVFRKCSRSAGHKRSPPWHSAVNRCLKCTNFWAGQRLCY